MAVTTIELQALIKSNASVDLAPYITTADLVVTEDLASSGLSVARIKEITLYLAAHFAILYIEKGGLTKYDVGESSEGYKSGSDLDRGYNLTRWGQQAVALDTTGTLALNANPTSKSEFRVV